MAKASEALGGRIERQMRSTVKRVSPWAVILIVAAPLIARQSFSIAFNYQSVHTPRRLHHSGRLLGVHELDGVDGRRVLLRSSSAERSTLVQAYGCFGVAAYLSYGVKKVEPIAKAGIAATQTTAQWIFLVGTICFFAYVEGYKGFQKGFSPRVVSRAWVVSEKKGPLMHKIMAPWFCIAYFHATRKRVITSWCVTTVIFLTVLAVRKLSQPYRGIIDAGVVVGLLWGAISVLCIFAKSLMDGRPPRYDPTLPAGTPYSGLTPE